MANPNILAPFGLDLYDTEGRECKLRRYVKKTSEVIALGDPVKQDSTGTVALALAGDQLLGVAAEASPSAAAAGSTIAVYDRPDDVFQVQANANVTQASIFMNANLAAGTADPAGRVSRYSLDSSSIATGSTLQLKIVGLSGAPATNVFGSYATVLVKINNSWNHTGVTGV